jgi:hypothetical protein
MSLENIDRQFRLDAEVAPTFVCKNYDAETRAFDVYYNDGTLKNDDWYGPLPMDLDAMKPDDEEPILYQISQMVYNSIERDRLHECDMKNTELVLHDMLDQEISVPMEELMRHRERMAKKDDTHVDPVVTSTTVVNVYNEDDFDLQFEALTQALAEEDAAEE